MKKANLLGWTWILAVIGVVAMVLMVVECLDADQFFTVEGLLGSSVAFFWVSIPYLTWAFLGWITRKRTGLLATSFLGGVAVCGGGLWWFQSLHAGRNSLEAALVIMALPFIQIVSLAAIVGFPVLLAHLNELEHPR